MKIGLVIKNLNVKGGTQRQFLELARYLKLWRHDVTIYALNYDKEKCYSLVDDLKVRFVQEGEKKYSPQKNQLKKNFLLRAFIRIFETYKEIRNLKNNGLKIYNLIDKDTDIINCHDLDTEEVGYFVSKKTDIPAVLQINDLPGVFGVGANIKEKDLSFKGRLKEFFLVRPIKNFKRQMIKACDLLTVNVEKNAVLCRKILGKDAKVIRPGTDTKDFYPLKNKPQNKVFKILSTGILFSYRRFEDLIMAGKILKNKKHRFEIKIVGSDRYDKEYGKKLKELVLSFKLKDHISFLGTVSDKELLNLYQTYDVFVFPNHNQSWGCAIFEAMACGVPVIVSKTVGASEVLTDNVDSLLVDPKNPKMLAKKIIYLMNNEDFCSQIVQKGYKTVKSLTWENYSKGMWNIFEQLSR